VKDVTGTSRMRAYIKKYITLIGIQGILQDGLIAYNFKVIIWLVGFILSLLFWDI